MRRFFVLLLLLLVFAGLGAAGFWFLGPYRAAQEETFVEIEHGMSSRSIADLLEREGLVRSRWAFLATRLLYPRARLQAGEFRFGPEQTPFAIFDKIRRGQVYFVVVTVPEGSNIFDIATILGDTTSIKAADFLRAAANASSIQRS